MMKFQKGAAYHEAGHAVARLWVGGEPMPVEVRRDGTGLSHGSGQVWRTAGEGQYALWDRVLLCLAGPWAEARAVKRSGFATLMTYGADDWREAQRYIGQIVQGRGASSERDAWVRAERETRQFVGEAWPDIERVAEALRREGRLDAEGVRRLATVTSSTGGNYPESGEGGRP